jgi:Concanavalin A-like lectin/glucanases superfamily
MTLAKRTTSSFLVCLAVVAYFLAGTGLAQIERKSLQDALHFHASFDGGGDAKVSGADGRIFTAESLERKQLEPGITRADVTIAKGAGKYGDCLRFADKAKPVICYSGEAMHYQPKDWSGTVSMWMRLNPDADLKPGYCDPLQITQYAWNNGAFFVDFDKDLPRDFRLGVFSDISFWNPKNVAWEAWPVEKRPMVTVKKPPFSRDAWTHVLFTFSGINDSNKRPAKATFYINGQSQGTLLQPLQFTWDVKKAAIMLGIEYIGDIDDVMIFRRELNASEVKFLYSLPESL